MNKLKSKISNLNHTGVVGVIIYLILSLPLLRNSLFGEKFKILDFYDGQLVEQADTFLFLAQFALYIPYWLDIYLFNFFEMGGVNFLVIIIMMPIVYRYFSFSRSKLEFIILLILFAPAPLLFLSTYNKEILLVIFLFMAYGYDKKLVVSSRGRWFLAYALTMRAYLVIIPLLMAVRDTRRFVLGAFLIFFLLISNDYTNGFVYRIFNRRLAEKGFDANSEIIQTVFVDSIYSLLAMLSEVLPQLLLPFLYNPNLKTLFFQIYVFLFLWCCIYYRSNYSNIMLVLFGFYCILDPDLGAFFRHLTSFFILFPLLLGMAGRKLNDK